MSRALPLRKVEGIIIFSFQLKKREREGRKVVEKLEVNWNLLSWKKGPKTEIFCPAVMGTVRDAVLSDRGFRSRVFFFFLGSLATHSFLAFRRREGELDY